MDVLVSILRQPSGLDAVLSRAAPEGGYREVRLAVEALPASLAPRVARLRAAYALLGQVLDLGPEVEAAARRVLAETVVDPEGRGHAVLPEGFGRPRALPRRTAAHPRGYQGTKVRPPKPPGPPLVDLRPVLCSAGGLRELRGRWRKLPRVRAVEPAGFARCLGWTLRGVSEPERGRLLALYWALDLDADPALRAAVARLVAGAPDAASEAWLDLLAEAGPGEARGALLHAALASPALSALPAGPAPRARDALRWIAAASSAATRAPRLAKALRALSSARSAPAPGCPGPAGLRAAPRGRAQASCAPPPEGGAGSDLAWFRAGVALAERFDPACDFARRRVAQVASSPGDVEASVRGFMARVAEDEGLGDYARGGFALDLWEACAAAPGLSAFLLEPGWRALEPRTCYALAHVLTRPARWSEPWRAFDPAPLRAVLAALADLAPEYRAKGVDLVGEVLVGCADGWNAALAGAPDLIAALCRSPHGTRSEALCVGGALARRSDRGVYLAAPPRAWRAVEGACARSNAARLIAAGAESLMEHAPALAQRGFARATGAFLRCAQTLGALPHAQRRVVLQAAQAELPTREELEALPLAALVQRLEALARDRGEALVRRKLRAHLRGERPLRPAQLDGHRRRLLAALPELALEAVRRRALVREGASLGFAGRAVEDPRIRHALLLRAWAEENRRGLNRVLRAVARGQAPRVERHPQNAAWFAAHPAVRRRRWALGIDLRGSADGRSLRLGLERDPLEALRLGTRVGSCLGVGGTFAHSAAAIALDANKAVVYARAGEAFVARQVLAITEDERLMCYEVYPQVSDAVLALFRAYDDAFARALGLERCRDSDPDVALLVAHAWYEDYPLARKG